jgi:hypothetical protein
MSIYIIHLIIIIVTMKIIYLLLKKPLKRIKFTKKN